MSTLKQLQGDVAARMRRGDTFASVEAEVIDPSALSDAEKAALWLYGWSFVHWRRQRREAMAHIDVLAGTPRPRRFARKRLRLADMSSPERTPATASRTEPTRGNQVGGALTARRSA